jgi:hypothetical protein
VEATEDERIASLKSLERLVAQKVGSEDASEIMEPLFGMQELRQADADLPGVDIPQSLAKVRVNPAQPFVMQAELSCGRASTPSSRSARQFCHSTASALERNSPDSRSNSRHAESSVPQGGSSLLRSGNIVRSRQSHKRSPLNGRCM